MGCTSCGTGKPNGCKSNGGCSSGGCNKMNVHDWLANLPFNDPESSCKIVEISFNNGSRKEFYRNNSLQYFEKGEYVTVEGVSGFDMGEVSVTGELVRLQLKKKGISETDPEIKKILRRSSEKDMDMLRANKAREKEALIRSRAISRQLKLEMKLAEIEIQADGRKATFYYTADDRVDFRELIKVFAAEFRVKVEMRQIGSRQEAGKVGGIGSCGRELCCSTWLTDFKSVNTTAARYQNLSINQTKLSGQCGRLKCCLNYELDTYLDALQAFPEHAEQLKISKGPAYLLKKDIFKNLMWYTMADSSKHYPLTIERVKKIQSLNAQGIFPDELEAVEVVSSKIKEIEPEFVDVVGQITLRSLEKSDRKKKQQRKEGQRPTPTGRTSGRDGQQGRENLAQSGNRAQQGTARPSIQPNDKKQGPKAPAPNTNSGAAPRQSGNQGRSRNAHRDAQQEGRSQNPGNAGESAPRGNAGNPPKEGSHFANKQARSSRSPRPQGGESRPPGNRNSRPKIDKNNKGGNPPEGS